MEKVILKPIHHRGNECIGIYFVKNKILQQAIQKMAGAKWSKTFSCWYMQSSRENYQLLATALSGKGILDTGELKKYLQEKKRSNLSQNFFQQEKKPQPLAEKKIMTVAKKPAGISDENKQALQQFKQHLILKSYSPSTIRTYENEFCQFLNMIKNNAAKDFTVIRLKDYFQYCHTRLKLSENTLHSKINALKFYYEQVYPVGLKKYQHVLLCLRIIK